MLNKTKLINRNNKTKSYYHPAQLPSPSIWTRYPNEIMIETIPKTSETIENY